MNRVSIQILAEPANVVANIPAGTTVFIQNTGLETVFFFEGPIEELDDHASDSKLVGYPGFQTKSRTVTGSPIWGWCERGSSVLCISW